jgi:hypothetical protein
MGHRASLSDRYRRFYGGFGYYPGYGYGYGGYGNDVYENYDEADWGEQWSSLYEDNDGPYARSTMENPPGRARIWEIKDKPGKGASEKDEQ